MTLVAPMAPPRRRLRISSRFVIFALVCVMSGFALALAQTVQAEKNLRDRIGLTTETVLALDAALLAALDAETGQRGYLLTGDVSHLDSYGRGAGELPQRIDAARDLLTQAGGPVSSRIDDMAEIAAGKLSEMQRTIDLYGAGEADTAVAMVLTNRGKRAMDRLRDEVAILIAEERALLVGQERAFARVEARTGVLLSTLALASLGLVLLALWLERRTAQAVQLAAHAEELQLAFDKSDLLAREMDHRVKNLFAVIGAMISFTGRQATDLASAIETLKGRVYALSVAHSVSKGQIDDKSADLGDVIRATLRPHEAGAGRVFIEGPAVELPVRAVSSLGLVLHELATNAVKYGALSQAGGEVSVTWTVSMGGAVALDWREDRAGGGVVAPDGRGGFGSLMVQQAAQQLDAELTQDWRPEGLHTSFRFHPAGGGMAS